MVKAGAVLLYCARTPKWFFSGHFSSGKVDKPLQILPFDNSTIPCYSGDILDDIIKKFKNVKLIIKICRIFSSQKLRLLFSSLFSNYIQLHVFPKWFKMTEDHSHSLTATVQYIFVGIQLAVFEKTRITLEWGIQ